MGAAKAVDIYADGRDETIHVDAKASRIKTSWPIQEAHNNIWYIFVHLQSKEKLNRSAVNRNTPPEYFIAHGKEINQKGLITHWTNMSGIKYTTLNSEEYKERWDKLPPPP